MANELRINIPDVSTVYVVVRRNSDGYVWNGAAFEVWADGSIGNYDVALTARSGDFYEADFPIAITAGDYTSVYYEQLGASPAIADELIASDRFYWTGTAATSGSTVVLSPYALTTLASLKRHMRITSSADDTLLTELINAMSAEIERVTGRAYVARNYRWWLNVNGQRRVVLPVNPAQWPTRTSFGAAGAMTVTYSGAAIRATCSVFHDPESPDGGGVRLSSVSAAGMATTNNLMFASYPSASTMATAIAAISGWSATVLNNIPSNDLIESGGESAKSRTVTFFYPDQDQLTYNLDPLLGLVELSNRSGSGWWPLAAQYSVGSVVMPYRGFQYLLWEGRAGYETIPADVQFACNDMAKESWYAGKQNTSLGGYSLGPYSVTFSNDQEAKISARLAKYMSGSSLVGGLV